MKHKNSGIYCTVAHFDEEGNLLSECIKCANCKQWIRPEDMNEECIPKDEIIDMQYIKTGAHHATTTKTT